MVSADVLSVFGEKSFQEYPNSGLCLDCKDWLNVGNGALKINEKSLILRVNKKAEFVVVEAKRFNTKLKTERKVSMSFQ